MDTRERLDSKQAELPGVLELLWLLFMQPITLHHRLRACRIEKPGDSAWKSWRTPGVDQKTRRVYVQRMFTLLLLIMPCLTVALAFLADVLGLPVDFAKVAVGVAIILGYTRIVFYPLELLLQITLYALQPAEKSGSPLQALKHLEQAAGQLQTLENQLLQ